MKENSKKAGIHLLEKGKRGIFRVIFSRSGLILVLQAMQVLFLFLTVRVLDRKRWS